ncbi:TRAP transporter substrate-binding protein [Alkalibacillus haloalkaliphilus]|uniref:TRAP transporter substrate-binding protein n=1 Tax=Alkalibacillus haloalkaliphilus TaxID=94136 RepID=UPI0002EB08A3|nr:TRAP transporter substrate-binding protein [Alkalibacillus haloalkaliphilus]
MKKGSFVLVVAILALLLTACGDDEPETNGATDGNGEGEGYTGESYQWSIGYNTPEDSVRGEAARAFKDVVESQTDGAVTIEMHEGETLGTEPEMLEQVNSGALDMQLVGGGGMQNIVPEYATLALPFMVEDFDEAYAVLDGEIGDELKDMARESGFEVLAHTDLGFAQITNNVKPVSSPEDMEGITIRSPDEPSSISTFEQLGANVTTLAFTELYMGLQQGTADGQFNPLDAIYENNFHEVQDYLTLTNHFYYHVNFIMNADLFESLDSELQEIVLEGAEAARDVSREYTQEMEVEMLDTLEDEFVEIEESPDLDAFRDAIDYSEFYDIVGEDFLNRTQDYIENLN